ncbi:MAG: hypothetical protein LBU70_06130 [Chitinispirillales bacterium]|nr:hypothetical protein [Chitinispirillales bacterium]
MNKIYRTFIITAFCLGLAIAMACTPAVTRPVKDDIAPRETEDIVPPPDIEPEEPVEIKDDPPVTPEVSDSLLTMTFGEGIIPPTFERLDDGDRPTYDWGEFDWGERGPEEFDRTRPVTGGTATIYLFRNFMDDVAAEMVRLNPFGGADGQGRRFFTVTDSTHRRLEFSLPARAFRANGRRITSLDFVEMWSRFIKSRPAQGLALFRNVQGIEEFLSGKNPLIHGFSAEDENTIRIRFAQPDPLAFHRLNSSRLIGGPFMLGAYYTSESSGAQMKLLPNPNSLVDTAFLAECVVRMGGDPAPLVAFVTGQYSAVTLYSATDIAAARREYIDINVSNGSGASMHRLPSDRYFLACRNENDQVCRFLHGVANGADLLRHVGAEGEAITSVTTRIGPTIPRGGISVPQLPVPFTLIYRNDDPISKTVAEKLSADLNRAGLSSETAGLNTEQYENALVRGNYDGAIGWVSETVLENTTEQLHLASMWFADETDPRVRLRDYREIPLFSINSYILLKDGVYLHNGRLTGIWVRP